MAWCVLEDLIEDARVDSLGRRVAMSSVRRLANNLGVSKDTMARALRRLTSAELIAALPAPRADRGRFGGGAYLIRPAASPEGTAAGEAVVAPRARRRPRVRSLEVPPPSLFDAIVDDVVPGTSESEPAEVGTRPDRRRCTGGEAAADTGATAGGIAGPTGERWSEALENCRSENER